MKKILEIFVFDVESMGLYGKPFMVAGGIYTHDKRFLNEFKFTCPKNEVGAAQSDIDWVKENAVCSKLTHENEFEMREDFWKQLQNAKSFYPDLVIGAECLWPIEAQFMVDAVKQELSVRKWDGPHPFHEISSVMLAAGMNPMKTYDRTTAELPAHDPIADCRLSARLFFEATKILGI